jgi:methylated-DNA-protein-cysteine methyltransferase related protein
VVSPGFHARVFAVVRRVPAGRVATYGQIAAQLGSPSVARHVGFALAAVGNAEAPVPWHRIVNAQGRISARGDSAREQRALLEAEGVRFDARDRIDLSRYLYGFPARRQRST